MARVTIAVEDADQPDVVRLLSESDAYFAGFYPPNSNHLLDVSALQRPEIIFCAAREERKLVGMGALAVRARDWGEIKRMYVVPTARGHGLGRIILEFLEQLALGEGLRVLRLETGIRQEEALRLYRSAGFRDVGPFEGYGPDPNSLFLEKSL